MFVQKSNFGTTSAARCFYKEGQYTFWEHIHQFSEITYVLEGSIEITIDGIKETANSGDIVIVPPLKKHSIETPKYCKIWSCVFSNDFVLDFISTDELYGGGDKAVFTPSKHLSYFFDNRLIDSEESLIEFTTTTFRMFKLFIHAIYEEYTRTVPHTKSSNKNSTLATILLYINEHSKENISLKSVSAALGFSAGHISRCISQLNDMNFCTLLNSFRVENAKFLLITTDLKISEITQKSGFPNERSLHRAFIKITGSTPGEYRKRHKTK